MHEEKTFAKELKSKGLHSPAVGLQSYVERLQPQAVGQQSLN